jgi:3-phosphoshikimate 1-carboxyvinyltransferase
VTTATLARADRPLQGTVEVPGSKSVSNRALVCAALAVGASRVHGVADGDDTARMVQGLRQLGVRIDADASDLVVHGPIDVDGAPTTIDAGLAGTTSRFLTAVAALRSKPTVVTGAEALRRRPMGDLHRLLRELGADVVAGTEGRLPVTVSGLRASPDARRLVARGDVSSQFVSAVMMVAPCIGGVRLALAGDVPSRGYLKMTADVMTRFGARVAVSNDGIEVSSTPYRAGEFVVPADWSSAGYPFAAAAIAGGEVRVPGLRDDGTQPEAGFVEVLKRMGCTARTDERGIAVLRDPGTALRGVDADMSAMSDLVPTLAAVAVCATTPTRIRGVGFIRNKESDRIGDLAAELRECGAEVGVHDDGLSIEPSRLRGCVVQPHDDHRLAMSLALLSLREPGIMVADAAVVGKSWPAYWTAMRLGLGLG